LTEIRATK